MTAPPDTPAHHIRMARIYLQQARETVHRAWFFVLLTWAGERRLPGHAQGCAHPPCSIY